MSAAFHIHVNAHTNLLLYIPNLSNPNTGLTTYTECTCNAVVMHASQRSALRLSCLQRYSLESCGDELRETVSVRPQEQ